MRSFIGVLVIGSLTLSASAQLVDLWDVYFDGTGSDRDNISEMVVAADGSVFVSGETTTTGNFAEDIMTARYDADGNLLWMEVWVGPGGCSDYGEALAVDAANNVYVAGYGYCNSNGIHIHILKYSANGALLWDRTWFAAGSTSNVADDIALDNAGNVYVTGYSTFGTGNMILLKYDNAGTFQWERQFDSAGQWDNGREVEVDSLGNVYMAGRADVGSHDDVGIVKYDTNGNLQWSRFFGGAAAGSDSLDDMVMTTDDRIVIVGRGNRLQFNLDGFVAAYDTSGTLLWDWWYEGTAEDEDVIYRAATDAAGNVYGVGWTFGGPTMGDDILSAKIDAQGDESWVRVDRLDDSEEWLTDWGYGIDVNASGNVAIVGLGTRLLPGVGDGPPTEEGIFQIGVDGDGELRYTSFEPNAGFVAGTHLSDGGEVTLYGGAWTQTTSQDFWITRQLEQLNDCDGDGVFDHLEIEADPSLDQDGSGVLDSCEDVGDLDGSGTIGVGDLLILLGAWGDCVDGEPCPADIDGDGAIGVNDLLVILGGWV